MTVNSTAPNYLQQLHVRLKAKKAAQRERERREWLSTPFARSLSAEEREHMMRAFTDTLARRGAPVQK
jgi:glycine cleavage system regulatory protein